MELLSRFASSIAAVAPHSLVLGLCAWCLAPEPAFAQGELVGWGEQAFNTSWQKGPLLQLACGVEHSVGLRPDGTLAMWGSNKSKQLKIPPIPVGLSVVEVVA